MKPLPNLSSQLLAILDLCLQINARGAEEAHFRLSPHISQVYVLFWPAGPKEDADSKCASGSLEAYYDLTHWDHLTAEAQAETCQRELDALGAALAARLPAKEAAA